MHPAEWLTPAMHLALGGLVWRGFERVTTRIDRVETRMDSGFTRLEAKMDSGFTRTDAKIDALAEQGKMMAVDIAVLKERDRACNTPSRAANG